MSVQELRNSLALIHSLANDTTAENWGDKRLYVLQTCVRMSDTIAALEARFAGMAKVKLLDWSDVRSPDEGIRYHHVIADSPIGQWSVQWKGWKEYDDRTVFLDGEFVLNGGDSLEEAKAAAQADYERRILSALED